MGHFLEHQCSYFSENIIEKEYQGFITQLREVMALGKTTSPISQSQISALQGSEIGRNMSLRNIHDFFGYIDSINKISPSNKQINHLQETIQLFKLYYVR